MTVASYQQLEVWQKAMDLVVLLYEYSKLFPKEELYGLTSQLRRAAVSIPSNIAEGQGRRSTKDFLNFLSISKGSLFELETQVEIARRLGYLPAIRHEELKELGQTVGRLLSGLIRALEQKQAKQ
jgi:four helix bundle protein